MAKEPKVLAWKLVRKRRDGSYGSLFINRKAELIPGKWLEAREYKTKGFAVRLGWHAVARPFAPHLSKHGRVWVAVALQGTMPHYRPIKQGGLWYVAKWLYIIGEEPKE